MLDTRSREPTRTIGVSNRRFSHEAQPVRAARSAPGLGRRQLGPGPVCQCTFARWASFKRLVRVGSAICQNPQHSLPKATDSWADLKAAYHFLSNPRVTPDDIQTPHRRHARERCSRYPVVLVVQDLTDLDFTRRKKTKGLGKIGNGGGRGLLQHTALAVTPDAQVLGVLHQEWMICPEPPDGETRKERLSRPKKSDVWPNAVRAVGASPEGTRFVHVADRESDAFEFMQACDDHHVGFLLRAQHDRIVENGVDRLWSYMTKQAVRGSRTVELPARPKRRARKAKLLMRRARVRLDPPRQDPRFKTGREVTVVYVTERGCPADAEPVEWMLLTTEPADTVEDGWERVNWYRRRWLIEEFHKAEKSGCRLEASQLDDAADIERLAAIIAVVAVRLLQLRELADRSRRHRDRETPAQQAAALQRAVPWLWIAVVALADKKHPADPATLTPQEFWIRIARRGGYIGRKSDGRPGWATIWKGWYDFTQMFEGAELMASSPPPPECG